MSDCDEYEDDNSSEGDYNDDCESDEDESDEEEEEQGLLIVLHVNDTIHRIDVDDLMDFESLKDLVREYVPHDEREHKLQIAWEDCAKRERRVESNSDLRDACNAQIRDEGDFLRFFISVERKGPSQSSSDANERLATILSYCAKGATMNRSPLSIACDERDFEAVRALLQCTYDMVQNESEEVKTFARKPIDERVNKRETTTRGEFTPLHIALRRGQSSIMSLLIEHGADIEATADEYTLTPLHMAAEQRVGKHEGPGILALLLRHKANINATDELGMTPLHIALEDGNQKKASFLIKQRADLEAKNTYEWTALHIAARDGLTETAKLLVSLKANMEATTQDKSTPLHIAAEEGNVDFMEFLINQEANLEAKNENGKTPVESTRHKNIKELMQKASENDQLTKENVVIA